MSESEYVEQKMAERDATIKAAQEGATERREHPERFDHQGARLAAVNEQRERILNRTSVPADLPPVVTCALVGLSFVPGYPLNVRAAERLLSKRYWACPDDPEPVSCILHRNPGNEYDTNAIEVHAVEVPGADHGMLGHLPRAVAKRLAPDLDSGVEWSAVVSGVRTHPANPDNPGVDVRLTRAPVIEPGTATVDDVIAEAVNAMSWAEINFELATRDLPAPDGIEALRVALIAIYRSERADKGVSK
jgi:hypothetical protein